MAAEFNMQFFEASAKTGMNIDEIFLYLAKKVKDTKDAAAALNNQPQENIGPTEHVSKTDKKKGKKGCC